MAGLHFVVFYDSARLQTGLKNWLSAQKEVASQIFEKAPMTADPTVTAAFGGTGEVRIERRAARLQHEGEMKTVAERAVDRVTHGIKLGKAVSAGS